MSALCRSFLSVGKKIIFPELRRNISLSPIASFKKIIETKEGNTLTIHAEIVPDPDESRLLKREPNGACPLCSLGLKITHTDVLILSQFLRSDGCVLPRRITGLCSVQQKRLGPLVAMAQKAGLMPNINPAWSHKDPKKRYRWKAYNVYYDEKTIKAKYKNVTWRA